jgi:hypothetical protein
MAQVFVRTFGPFALDGRVVVNPGSVVTMEEMIAENFINRGLGEAASGPVFYAPANPALVKAEAEVSRLKAAITKSPRGSLERQELEDQLHAAQGVFTSLNSRLATQIEHPGDDPAPARAERAVAAAQR